MSFVVIQSRFSATAAGTDSGATASRAADSAREFVVTNISGHTDADSIIQITDGSTVLWESKIGVSAEGFSFCFDVGGVPVGKNKAATGIVASSTADCQVNISGYSVP